MAAKLLETQLMKRKLLTATIAALTIGSASSAFAGFPTVYGKINLTLHKYDFERLSAATGASVVDDVDNWSLESNNSRIGIRGDFDINADLKAIYKLEYGVDVDNGTNSNGREFTTRNIYGGFQGGWGTLFAGRNDTPLKLIQTNTITQSDIDRFNDMPLADINTYLVGENRADSVIQYTSPILFGGLEFALAAAQIEENGTNSTNDDDNLASGKSVAVTYGKSSWYAAVAYDNNIANSDTVRAVGEVTFGPVKVGAIYQTSEQHEKADFVGQLQTSVGTSQTVSSPIAEWDGSATANAFKEQEGYVINAAWKVAGPWTVKAQYGHSDTTPQQLPVGVGIKYKDVSVDAIAAGVDYKLNDNAKLFAYYASVDADGDSRVSTKSTEDKTYAVGFDLKF
jgi:predicted porin